jgi:site-specific recombinase XerC
MCPAHGVDEQFLAAAARLTADDVQAFVNRRTRDGVSPSMTHHVLVVRRMASKLAVQRRRIMFNPTEGVHGPKVGAPLDAADTQKLLEKARAQPLGAMWFLAASLGLRFAEVAGLRWRDVNLEKGAVAVRHQLQVTPPKEARL